MAISADSAEESRALARRYDIEFPLLSDPDGALAKKYAGLSSDGFALPSLYIIKPDGRVLFRKLGEARHDRVSVARVLQLVDEMNGVSDLPEARGYERPLTLRLGVGVGVHKLEDDTSFSTGLEAAAYYDLMPYLSVGLALGGLAVPEQEVQEAGLLRAQLPYWDGVGEFYLQLPLGMAYRLGGEARDRSGWYHGIAFGNEFELSPFSLIYVELGLHASVFTGEADDEYSTSTRLLFAAGYGWRF